MKWKKAMAMYMHIGWDSEDGHWFLFYEGSTKTWCVSVTDWDLVDTSSWAGNGCLIADDLPTLRVAKQLAELLMKNNPEALEDESQ